MTKDQIELVKKIKNRTYINDKIKNTNYSFELPQDLFPMSKRVIAKRNFMPSKYERIKISKIIHAMKMGWIKPKGPEVKRDRVQDFFNSVEDIWHFKAD